MRDVQKEFDGDFMKAMELVRAAPVMALATKVAYERTCELCGKPKTACAKCEYLQLKDIWRTVWCDYEMSARGKKAAPEGEETVQVPKMFALVTSWEHESYCEECRKDSAYKGCENCIREKLLAYWQDFVVRNRIGKTATAAV